MVGHDGKYIPKYFGEVGSGCSHAWNANIMNAAMYGADWHQYKVYRTGADLYRLPTKGMASKKNCANQGSPIPIR